MKVISLQGDFRTSDLDVIPAIQAYCEAHSLEFRCERASAWLWLALSKIDSGVRTYRCSVCFGKNFISRKLLCGTRYLYQKGYILVAWRLVNNFKVGTTALQFSNTTEFNKPRQI